MGSTEIPQDIRDGITEALQTGDEAASGELTQRGLDLGCDALEMVQTVIVPALTDVGDRFQKLEIFLPELMLSAKAAQASTTLLEAAIIETSGEVPTLGTVVLGTVDKDIHDIGKNILVTLMKANGFKVIDVGRNINAKVFVDAALENDADIIGASSLMTITKAGHKQIIELLKARDLRDRFKVIIGGGSVDERYAEMIGADGYANDASGGVAMAKQWMAEG
jgi:methylmalonyl-CoA mutase cobalamin-binding domain/chain